MSITPDTEPWWLYRADVTRAVDGDTYDATIDLGFRVYRDARVRLADVDTNEIYGSPKGSPEYEAGLAQTAYAEQFLAEAEENWDGDWPVLIRTQKDQTGKYGRLLAWIQRRADGAILNQALRDEFDL